MAMQAECPRCATALAEDDGTWACPMHGPTAPLLRTTSADYDSLVEHLATAGTLPSWAPWPLPAGWAVTGFGAVATDHAASATFVTCSGLTETDGSVRLTVVTEEPGVGLGARVAGVVHDDPGAQTADRPVQTRARVGGALVPLWLVPATGESAAGSEQEDPWDRAVLVGESEGRWLWLVTTPASAALGIDLWGSMEDLGRRGPELVDLAFGRGAGDW
jgi:hypothetical protein